MKGLKRDVLRLAFLGALWIAHSFLPTATAADGCVGCVGCSAHNSNFGCCAAAWHQWDSCENGEGGCSLGNYCGGG